MKQAVLKTSFIVCALFVSGLFGQKTDSAFSTIDSSLFPPEFFPDLTGVSEEELILAGLRTLYPNRILAEEPVFALPDPEPSIIRELGSSGRYIRVKNLAEALPLIEEHLSAFPLLVLDFRFLTADAASTGRLGALLTRKPIVELRTAGNYPLPENGKTNGSFQIRSRQARPNEQTIFTLSNHETRGPIEALLAQLKADGDVISIGTPSAGATAVFEPFPNLESYYLISGEIRPADGSSLVETGFIPQVEVEVDPDDDRLAYSALREGVKIQELVEARVDKPRFDEAHLLREQNGTSSLSDLIDETDENLPDLPIDTTLQRALHIVKALQALGRIPG